MSRTLILAATAFLAITPWTFGQTEAELETSVVQLRDGLVSYGHDPDCAGCRAFLAGYGTGAGLHSPSCACAGDGAAADAGPGAAVAEDYDELFASDFGAGLGYESAAPGMVGDFFGGGYKIRADEFRTFQQDYFNVSVAGADRRFKLAENNSPFPIDRVFINFNHFHNALQTANAHDANLDRGVVGIEKTFFDQWWSYEFRLPFMSGLNGDQVIASANANNVSNEIGNIGMAVKRLLFRNDILAASMGVGIILPSGPDSRIFQSRNSVTPEIEIDNEAFYLQPFAGLWWTPNDRFFSQFAIQADFDGCGNPVLVDQTQVGIIQDQTLLFLDASFGYWLLRDPYSGRIVTGIAPMIELHHSSTLVDSDVVDFNSDVGGGSTDTNNITNPSNRQDVLNLTGALRLEIGGRSYLTFAGVAPLRTAEKLFDTEFSVQYTRFY